MSDAPKTAAPPALGEGKKFKDMSGGERVVFLVKSIIFILTSGFAFPTIWSD